MKLDIKQQELKKFKLKDAKQLKAMLLRLSQNQKVSRNYQKYRACVTGRSVERVIENCAASTLCDGEVYYNRRSR